VKVTDASGAHGRLLAEADGLIPNPAEGAGNHVCILEVKFEDLGNLAWTLDLNESSTPTLIVNQKIDNKEFVRSNSTFFALVYPAVIREILANILSHNDYEYEPDDDDWKNRWIRYVTSLPGVPSPPKQVDESEMRQWIDDTVKSFCNCQAACQSFLDSISEEKGT
jgi:hypothetical protein